MWFAHELGGVCSRNGIYSTADRAATSTVDDSTTDDLCDERGALVGASSKEAAYYDSIFEVIDLDKSGTLNGQETVKFLSLSGLTKPQLKVHSFSRSSRTSR